MTSDAYSRSGTAILARMRLVTAILLVLMLLPRSAAAAPRLELIKLPKQFRITLFAEDIPGARSLALGERGTVFVGTRKAGRVYALRANRENERAIDRYVIAEGLNDPNGVALYNGALYVAEIQRISRYDGIEDRLADPPKPVIVKDDLPKEEHHGWKFIAFGPDGKLYLPIGAPCNICKEKSPLFATICRMDPDGGNFEIFAHGVRNTVGFDWRPDTGILWFTDNGRDWLGDDTPPDELNSAKRAGLHFGFPYCHGRGIRDPEFGKQRRCEEFAAPALELAPHTAALGMRFYSGAQFPPAYRGGIFIAEHGSWNRSTPIGYRIMFVPIKNGEAASYDLFADGWLQGGRAWGRPVDVLVLRDGSLLVSDDFAGSVYRISYGRPPAPTSPAR